MRKITSYIFVGFSIVLALFSSCNNSKKGKDGRTDTYSSGTISFVSDESFSPIIEEERAVFQYDYPQATLNPIYTNESDAINKLLSGKTWLAFSARKIVKFKASKPRISVPLPLTLHTMHLLSSSTKVIRTPLYPSKIFKIS